MECVSCPGGGEGSVFDRLPCGHFLCVECSLTFLFDGWPCPQCGDWPNEAEEPSKTVYKGCVSCDSCDTDQTLAQIRWCNDCQEYKCPICRSSCTDHEFFEFSDLVGVNYAFATLSASVKCDNPRDWTESRLCITNFLTRLKTALKESQFDLAQLAHLNPKQLQDRLTNLPLRNKPEKTKPTSPKKQGRRNKKKCQEEKVALDPETADQSLDLSDTYEDAFEQPSGYLAYLNMGKSVVKQYQPSVGSGDRIVLLDTSRGDLSLLDTATENPTPRIGCFQNSSLSHCSRVDVEGKTYLSGGTDYFGQLHSSFFGLDLTELQYEPVNARTPVPVTRHSTVSHGEALFLLGGLDQVAGKEHTRNDLHCFFECPSPSSETQESPSPSTIVSKPLSRMKRARASFATTTDGTSIYVFGGMQSAKRWDVNYWSGFLNHCERYDPGKDVWLRVPPLPHARAKAQAVNRGGRVVLVGGDTPLPYSPRSLHSDVVPICLYFDPRLGRWSNGPEPKTKLLDRYIDYGVLVDHPRGLHFIARTDSEKKVMVLEERMETWRFWEKPVDIGLNGCTIALIG